MDKNNIKVLLVDDEADILEFLSYNLKHEGFQVFTAKNGKEGIEKARNILPQLIILDVMMPEMDGIEACAEIRKIPELKSSLVIFLTARAEDYSQIAGFDAGADDYITKPIRPKLFITKINSLLRRYLEKLDEQFQEKQIVIFNAFTIDQERYLILKVENEITLPKKEFELLLLLTTKPNKVFTREEIFANVWGNLVIVGDRTIDVHIRKIREKIGVDCIKTVKGVGYKFEDIE
ncbi:MAG: response regulator transcription factor [Bacteroidales bacterium]|jgi:two-component system alkaline phosphatase synthesis response regulator PhoP|nr:response regulator transcription factor [Bacteroidales bacterium]